MKVSRTFTKRSSYIRILNIDKKYNIFVLIYWSIYECDKEIKNQKRAMLSNFLW